MFRRIVWLGMAGMLVVGWAALASAATTEEVLSKLTKQRGEVKSFEFDMKTTMKMQGGDAGEATMAGHMASQVVEKDGKPATLMNMKQKMTMGEMTHDMLMVNDGEFMWMEMKDPMSGQTMVMKNKANAGPDKNNPQEFTDMYDLKLIGEEKFDGQTCWVLEGTPKAKAAAPARRGPMGQAEPETGKIRMYVGQADLFTHRYLLYDKAGNQTAETVMSNVKVNPKLDEKLFKYTPPAGARVIDMTKGGMPMF